MTRCTLARCIRLLTLALVAVWPIGALTMQPDWLSKLFMSIESGQARAAQDRLSSLAARAVIPPQDIVMSVIEQPIASLEDFRRTMVELDPANGVRIRYGGNGHAQFFLIGS